MDIFAQERDRLLSSTARTLGIACASVSLLALVYPGVTQPTHLLGVVPLVLLQIVALVLVGRTGSRVWVLVGLATGMTATVVALLPADGPTSPSLATAVIPLAGGATAAFTIVLTSSRLRIVTAAVAFVVAVVLVSIASGSFFTFPVAATALGWVLVFLTGVWLGRSVPLAARRIYSIGNAHRAERQASETEAQRRQGARLLHDTVLATLTLLAHSGFGVTPQALQAQAAEDARLLRHLRLGGTPQPQASGDYSLETVEESPLGQTLESVKQRFGRMGLEVSWHGTGQVLLPTHVLDAFLLALAECLENVRRHAGVTEAHVTIIHDDDMVRAMVTDAGVGFDLTGVSEERLGFKESVVGRLREVGGSARLFSSPGAGTTVVLEAPR
ncbi:signal transduction histidine kinase [Frigoribacterium sp. PhB160]|jgi:signal transduction histidine kinase|uniref:sensor histidine kinase n=1 Tax=Frigoribacterium sp. PhB160 TaxID=2485192 RepID=UPI000F4A39A0|nr:ATP-binding protein [Frigoribacterium sp. PhB160]ROS61992.1 signal transduction histidine kinase [Frigoribacterium sp. PhB160]